MKITDIEVIQFRTTTRGHPTKWGYGIWGEEVDSVGTITKISTDEGVEGHMLGGDKATMEGVIKPLILGENPLHREQIWHWMDQMSTFSHRPSESEMGLVDCALWDLLGNKAGLPVYQLLGGAREKVRAYASTFPNLGGPEVYAEHARACKAQGYKAYKVHAYICWNPHTEEPAPQLPGFPKEDVEVCKAVREAVGDDMVLMLDPFGVYTLDESIWVGRELEKLNYYWLEHPMVETRVEAYRRLCRELDIAICSPEHVPGGVFSRAEWILQGACDMMRVDIFYGGITGCWKVINLCQAYGIQCELHGTGAPHVHLACAAPEATCRYYERGLLRPGVDYEQPPPYLKAIDDPIDSDGNVIVSQKPGLGIEYDWDYIEANRIET